MSSTSVASKVITAGFAIFSMIFGSGNVVFPLIVGKDFFDNCFFAIVGWLLATVIIPMVGYFGAMLFDADHKKYLAPIGKHATAILMFLIMMMVGPFGVIARGINVSFGGIHILSPSIPTVAFNFIYCSLMVLIAWNPGKIVQILGLVFTPLKFGGLLAMMLIAWYISDGIPFPLPEQETQPISACLGGFMTGYQTMDLLAAFIMASTIYRYLKNVLPPDKQDDKKHLIKLTGWSCLIGAVVLGVVYSGLVVVGAQYTEQLTGVSNEALFPRVAEVALGSCASWFVAIVIAVCCLATNIALTSVFTDYLHKDILKEKFNRRIGILFVGGISFVMSLLGFEEICAILGKILEVIYPLLILFVMCRIIHYYISVRKSPKG
ncbi:MAG: branched-chain amino acid transport system II carrier protein [Holosporales bacterium]|jgi:LIVCS family branched-chain amino acid:cation transporter|nr:branched-chain amino acid transport system II carrier protein [Holosporales bacterium]